MGQRLEVGIGSTNNSLNASRWDWAAYEPFHIAPVGRLHAVRVQMTSKEVLADRGEGFNRRDRYCHLDDARLTDAG